MLKLRIERTGVIVPPPSPTVNPRYGIWRDLDGGVYAYTETLGDEYRMHLPGLASFRFNSRGDEIAAEVHGGTGEELVLDAYRRRVLPMALQVSGREVLHASAFRAPGGVVALCADSGTGKSTIALGLNGRGYPLWADDLVAFEASDQGSRAISLPFKPRLRPSAAALFGGKAIGLATEAGDNLPAAGTEAATLSAICVLRRADMSVPAVTVRRLSPAESLAAVLAHAWYFAIQDGERKRRMISHYLELVAGISVFEVSFLTGLEHLSATLDAIEDVAHGSVRTTCS